MEKFNYLKKDTADTAELWLQEINFPASKKTKLQLNPSMCALVVIDMNNYFASPLSSHCLPASASIIPNIDKLLTVWRHNNNQVVFTRHGHDEKNGRDMMKKFFKEVIKSGSPESDFIDSLKPEKDEKIIDKNTYDAFYRTGLENHLHLNNIEQVLLTGVVTQMCVETTARSAFCRGFEVYIAVDATAAYNERLHLASLKSMATSVAVPLSTAGIVKICQRQ